MLQVKNIFVVLKCNIHVSYRVCVKHIIRNSAKIRPIERCLRICQFISELPYQWNCSFSLLELRFPILHYSWRFCFQPWVFTDYVRIKPLFWQHLVDNSHNFINIFAQTIKFRFPMFPNKSIMQLWIA